MIHSYKKNKLHHFENFKEAAMRFPAQRLSCRWFYIKRNNLWKPQGKISALTFNFKCNFSNQPLPSRPPSCKMLRFVSCTRDKHM
ncbi:hypothetical protein CEXT_164561 [Caerostris extrusa]|uniref:Uncharacterized protein n=1 Tax=Caerostris extrusa TaxID=172846 RepID=A0AAV4SGY1_CAEEX|nr:hypothetical protein CEXT_164561 [Caerostris extrusa]